MKTDSRIDDVESRLEFQEDTIAALNAALVKQQNRLDLLEKSLQSLIEQVNDHVESAEEAPEPPPPHY